MGIKYEDIKKANDAIVTTVIEKVNKRTGEVSKKDYAEVNQRVKAFRMVYPDGTISTEMLSNENGVCIFRAMVYSNSDPTVSSILAVGHAYEKEDSSFINQTSYIENCETSAVGRALGFAGFGIDTSIASCEEVKNAMLNQPDAESAPVRKASPKQIEVLAKTYTGANLTKLLKTQNIEKLEDLPMDKASELISKLRREK